MSEIKFPCPACGQNIVCDSAHTGAEIACPSCQHAFKVPAQLARPTSSPPARPAVPAAAAPAVAGRTSALAIASLVCSLTCFGCLPGIICGHLARGRIRRNPGLRGGGLALAGLIIGYLVLATSLCELAIGISHLRSQFRQSYQAALQGLSTNGIQFNPGVSVHAGGTFGTDNSSPATGSAGWTSDILDAQFPAGPVTGKLHGTDFTAGKVTFVNDTLTLSVPAGGSGSVTIANLPAAIEGTGYELQPASGTNDPQIQIAWTDAGQPGSESHASGYYMKLKFDKAVKRKVSGQIYLCLPDDSHSYVAGTFQFIRTAKVKRKQPPA
jgi:DNA-directed RNA polymerase subunit RPC12/RpoP